VMVVATSLGGMKTTDVSPTNISIHGQGPTVVAGAIQGSKLQFSISDGVGAIPFEDGAAVQVSTNAQGTAFLGPDAVKLYHSGRVLVTKGRFGGAKLQDPPRRSHQSNPVHEPVLRGNRAARIARSQTAHCIGN